MIVKECNQLIHIYGTFIYYEINADGTSNDIVSENEECKCNNIIIR